MGSLAPRAEDLTVYPEEERVGEDMLQRLIIELLRPLIQRWLDHRGEQALVGADQFIYFEQYNPHRRVAPDVYVLPGVASDTAIRSWKVWETGVVPSFALEVASTNWEKDYCQTPVEHDELGTSELLIFDPSYTQRRDGVRWQRFARNAAGRLVLIERSDGRAVNSSVLGCAVRAVGVGQQLRLRLAEGVDTVLFPTAEEAERQAKEAERRAKEAERQAKEAERQAKEAERQAKEEALARLAELEARLAKYEKVE